MNKVSYGILATILCVVLSFILTSCETGEELLGRGEIREEYIMKLLNAGESCSFVAVDCDLYDCPYGKTEWEKVNLEELDGWSACTPSNLIIDKGVGHVPASFFCCANGLDPFYILWDSYVRKTHPQYIYLDKELSYNPESNLLKVGDMEYEVLEFNAKSVVLCHNSDYAGGSSGKGGTYREIRRYMRDDSIEIDGENNRSFATMFEIYHFFIDRAREQFGERININEIYYGIAQYPNDYIEISNFEALLTAMEERNTLDCKHLMRELGIELY